MESLDFDARTSIYLQKTSSSISFCKEELGLLLHFNFRSLQKKAGTGFYVVTWEYLKYPRAHLRGNTRKC